VYYQRAVKGNVKSRADSIGEQLDTSVGAQYVREQRSVSARETDMNTGIAGSSQWMNSSVSNATTASAADGIGGLRTAIGSMGLNAKFTGATYRGGEVSSSEYVDSFGTTATAGHSTYNMTEISGGGKSVWQDGGLE